MTDSNYIRDAMKALSSDDYTETGIGDESDYIREFNKAISSIDRKRLESTESEYIRDAVMALASEIDAERRYRKYQKFMKHELYREYMVCYYGFDVLEQMRRKKKNLTLWCFNCRKPKLTISV